MLAYRHSFHAGNHADVLKHITQIAVLRYFNEKDKPYWVVDTHAGAGMYSLDGKYAQRNAEFEQGISTLYGRDDCPPLVADYVAIVKGANVDRLIYYPGSPAVSAAVIRPGDKQRLFELHPSDYLMLSEHYAKNRSVTTQHSDGFVGLKAVLPPPTRRAVTLIDPSYELKEDYDLVFNTLKECLLRFAQGTYLIWYPILNRPQWRRMVERLQRLDINWLNVSMTVAQADAEGFGMEGSGVFVVNPPWTLEAQLKTTLPYLVKHLGQFARATHTLQSYEPKKLKGK